MGCGCKGNKKNSRFGYNVLKVALVLCIVCSVVLWYRATKEINQINITNIKRIVDLNNNIIEVNNRLTKLYAYLDVTYIPEHSITIDPTIVAKNSRWLIKSEGGDFFTEETVNETIDAINAIEWEK
jgi:Na+-transporting NADH:ubiquinone oxidoreductase subunit NqrC